MNVWPRVYSFVFVPCLWVGFHVLALVNRKVRRGLRGRRTVVRNLEAFLASRGSGPRLWVHASSMGEFEQAKPIIEALKTERPDLIVIATFFSPSGYENSLRYPHADHVTYIPFDTRRNARAFLDVLQPDLAALIRYDLWPNHLWECSARGIPIVLTNATLRADSRRRTPGLRSFHRAVFNTMESILTVSADDAANFASFYLSRPTIDAIGDTRYDRVASRARAARSRRLLDATVTDNRHVLIAGSSWSEDEEVLLPVLLALRRRDPSLLAIIVPHEPTEAHLETLEYKLRGRAASIRFSYMNAWNGEPFILVDSIGILLSLYAHADVAFVGGGFKSNVHNTLEPAAYGIPVVYGPKIGNSREARELSDAGGGFIVRSRRDLYRTLRTLFSGEEPRLRAGSLAGDFVHSRAGATARIVAHVLPYLDRRSRP